MGEPARKLDRDHPRPEARPGRSGRRGRVLSLRRQIQGQRKEDTWVLDQIALWYRTRHD